MTLHSEPFKRQSITPLRGLVLLFIACTTWLSSCGGGPKAIPEEVMRDIMRDAFISNSIALNAKNIKALRPTDSLDLHTRIIERYDYTMADFRFTIREMSVRKSNPLDNILSGVAADMKIASDRAELRYKAHLRADSLAQARTCDTVFRSDTVLRGELDGYTIEYTGLVAKDSIVPSGDYRLIFDYSTGAHARSYSKSIRVRQTTDKDKIVTNTLWIEPAKDTAHYAENIGVGDDLKKLEISLKETRRNRAKPDTCYLTNVRLVYILSVKQAREQLLQQLTDFEPIKETYEKRYIESLQELSGPTPPYAKWETAPQRIDSVRLSGDSSERRAVR